MPQTSAAAEADPARLAEQVRQLDALVRDRLASLDRTQQEMEDRERRLVTLQRSIRQAAEAFSRQVERAQQLAQQLDAPPTAPAENTASADATPLAQRMAKLAAFDQQIDRRMARLQQIHKQTGEQADRYLSEEVERRVQDKLAHVEADAAEKLEAITRLAQTAGRSVTEALDRLADRARAAAEEAEGHVAASPAAPPPSTPAAPVVTPDPLDTPLHAIAKRLRHGQPTPQQGAA